MYWALAIAAAAATAGPFDAQEGREGKPLIRDGAVRDARAYARTREEMGPVSFAVAGTGHRVRGYRRTATYPAASVTKAMLLVKVLRDARDRRLTAAERDRLGRIIRESKNQPARRLFAQVGSAGLYEIAEAAGMEHFSSDSSLFESRIAAGDQARFFLRIDRLVPERHRRYARRLLSGTIEAHRWGIPPAAEKRHMRWFIKGGWRSDVVHQVGLLERSRTRRIAVGVLTTTTDQGYGRATVEGVARRVLARQP